MPWKDTRAKQKRFEELVSDLVTPIYRTAVRLAGNPEDAEDLTQETFLKAYRSLHQLTDSAGAQAWLFRILHNAWVDRLRKQKRRPQLVTFEPGEEVVELPKPPLLDVTDPAHRSALEQKFDQEVLGALYQLPEEERLAVLFQTCGGLTYKEIAAALECPIGTVMSRLNRGKARLREDLAAYAAREGFLKQTNEERGGDEVAEA